MTATLTASAAHVATTRSGGQIIYQADSIQILDAIAAFIVFFVVLCWGAIVSGSGDAPALIISPKRQSCVGTWRGSGVGRLWVRQYFTAVIGG